jgi:hypothetical protein
VCSLVVVSVVGLGVGDSWTSIAPVVVFEAASTASLMALPRFRDYARLVEGRSLWLGIRRDLTCSQLLRH